MKVNSTIRAGFRADGSQPLLEVGENDLSEEKLGRALTTQERAFVEAMVDGKLASYAEAPPPPKSGPRAVEEKPRRRAADPKPAAKGPRKRVARRA